MKDITFTVPCYNSQEYMHRCIDTLLAGGDRVEIIIVNDGSSDETGAIADRYQEQYPDIVRVVHQPNGGHGSGVNAGVQLAQGRYFKVVDSDDWVGAGSIAELLKLIDQWDAENARVDMVVCNYVYEQLATGKSKRMRYHNVFPRGRIAGWGEVSFLLPSQYLLMHSLIFRTEILRARDLELPRHTFYVDNIFAVQYLSSIETIYYLDCDFYHYAIGREDQSVNEQVHMSRIDQQIRVTKLVIERADLKAAREKSRRLSGILIHYIAAMMMVSSTYLSRIGTPEAYRQRTELWEFVRENDARLYSRLRYLNVCTFAYLPGSVGRETTLLCYRLAKRIYKFN